MPLVLKDRVRETTTSTGTGTITLAGAVSGFQSFSVIGNGNTTYYAIIDSVNGTWEVGIGTYTSAGTTLSRDTVLSSSNSGSLVSFAAGTKDVICTQPSSKAIYGDANNNVGINGTTSAWNTVTALQIQNSSFYNATGETGIVSNTYYNSGWKYISTGAATQYIQSGGGHYWLNAPSGTAGNAISFTQAMTLDASGRLLVGRTSSAGSAYSLELDNATTDNRLGMYAGGALTGGLLCSTNELRMLGFGASTVLTFQTNGTERARIDTSGNLGIGTSSPASRIHINNGASTATALTMGPVAVSGDYSQIVWTPTSGSQNLNFSIDGGFFKWSRQGSEFMRLDSSGNLGLGVTPQTWWSSRRVFQYGSAGSLTSFIGSGGVELSQNWYLDNTATNRYLVNGGATQYLQTGSQHAWYTAPSGTAGNAISFTQAMTLDASGNLGIGTSSPGTKLDVQGTGNTTLRVQTNTSGNPILNLSSAGDDGASIYYGRGTGLLNIDISSVVGAVRLNTSGNLGLGVTPSAWGSTAKAFSIRSSGSGIEGSIGNSGATNAISFVNNAYYNAGWKYVYSGGSFSAGRYDIEGNVHSWFTAPSGTAGNAISFTQAMTLDANGKLSIGTTSAPSGSGVRAVISNANGGGLQFDQSGSGGAVLPNGGSAGLQFFTYTGGVGSESYTERARIDASGNLGLGVTPSAWGLTGCMQIGAGKVVAFNGDGYITRNAYFNGSWIYTTTSSASMYGQELGAHKWFTAPSGTAGNTISFTQAMTLDNSGRLAIGSTAPQSWSTSQAVIEMYPSNGAGYINMNGASTYGGYLYWNMYFNGTSNICINTGAVGAAGMNGSGGHDVYVGTGTAGSAASLTLVTSIDSSANFMVGTSSSTGAGGLTIQSVTNGRTVYNNNNGAATGFVFQTFRRSGTEIGSITQNGTTAVLYNTTSDYRLKENVQPISGALDRVAKLKPSTYRWKSDGSDGEGFLAHELAEVCPLAVNGEKDAVDAKGDPKYQSIDPSKVVALLTAAVQELTQQVRELKAEVATLKGN